VDGCWSPCSGSPKSVNATRDIIWLAENGHGGEAGERFMGSTAVGLVGPDAAFGELEVRLALGTLASAQRQIIERLESREK
jgi:hypothetical protein